MKPFAVGDWSVLAGLVDKDDTSQGQSLSYATDSVRVLIRDVADSRSRRVRRHSFGQARELQLRLCCNLIFSEPLPHVVADLLQQRAGSKS